MMSKSFALSTMVLMSVAVAPAKKEECKPVKEHPKVEAPIKAKANELLAAHYKRICLERGIDDVGP